MTEVQVKELAEKVALDLRLQGRNKGNCFLISVLEKHAAGKHPASSRITQILKNWVRRRKMAV